MHYLIISSSLDPKSRSRLMARHAMDRMIGAIDAADQVAWLDAATLQLPLCDNDTARRHEDARNAAAAIRNADGILLALGIYNFAASAVAKTLVELGGDAWKEKVVGFLCASGGPSSYMAVMGLANSLMLDFRCVIVPRFVFATASAFDGEHITDQALVQRANQLVADLVRMTAALRSSTINATT
jgi:NAD(P)H-dependent FMN reductase